MLGVKKRLEDAGVVPKETRKITKYEKDVADKAIIYDLGMHAVKYPAPYSIMLISGDRDYANSLIDLHNTWGHNIILAIPSGSWVWFHLTDASDSLLYWANVVRGADQPNLSLKIREDMMLVEEKQSTEEGVRVSVETQLQVLSLNDVTPIQLTDLTGKKRELVEFVENSSETPVDLTGPNGTHRTLIALLRKIGNS